MMFLEGKSIFDLRKQTKQVVQKAKRSPGKLSLNSDIRIIGWPQKNDISMLHIFLV